MRNRIKRGVTSIMVLLIMFVAMTVMLGLAGAALSTLKRSDNEQKASLNFNVAQAALEMQLSQSYSAVKYADGEFVQQQHILNHFANSITPGASAYVNVQPTSVPGSAWFTSVAAFEGKRTSIRMFVRSKDVSIWNNAIFAGTGASGQSINGNVDIRGSVHILGEGEPFSDLNGNGQWDKAETWGDTNGNGVWDPGEPFVDSNNDGVWNSAEPFNDTNFNGYYDPPLTTTDLSGDLNGGAHIGNTYTGMPVGLENLVPNPPIVNGQESLGTEVRAKHGQVAISGTATLGFNYDPDGGTSKGTIESSFVSDGYTGNQGASQVYSDNGTNQGYDLNNLDIEFPVLSGIGAQEYKDASGVVWSDQKLFLDNRAMVIPVNEIDDDTAAFSYGPDAYGNSITYTPGTSTGSGGLQVVTPPMLDITGIVKVNGDLDIYDQAELRYRGNGTMYATGDIYLGNDFLPEAGTKFPTDNVFGLIAGRNMNLATGGGDSQISMAGAFYAMGTIVSAKQNQIAGTFVANFFDMGKNVPNIYQVPTLKDNMPPGMPGDEPYITLKIKSWRQRSLTQIGS